MIPSSCSFNLGVHNGQIGFKTCLNGKIAPETDANLLHRVMSASCEAFRMPAMTSPSPRGAGRRPKCTKARSRGVWGTDRAAGATRMLASPSVEGMASARGDVGVKRGVHLIEHAECIKRRLADQAWGRKAATRIAERLHKCCARCCTKPQPTDS